MITTARSPSSPRKNDILGGSFIHSHGTKVFMRPRLDGVQDAVAQAQFTEKRWVWVQDDTEAYVRGHIIQENEKDMEVELENGLTCTVLPERVFAMNPPKFDRVDDMAELTHLNEPSVIHNLTMRYRNSQIYTYSGLFLVAVNPYRKLSIYSDEYIQSYKGRRRGEMSPHIYAVADQAYHDMLQDNENQSILITGESGAGKTENTKIVIQYLAAVASHTSSHNSNLHTHSAHHQKGQKLEQQILQANPILEAFGNAQTIRNNNSSRFGKFIRIEFNTRAQICGANIEWYLLEKSRVHQQSSNERNYHIFYQLLSAEENIKEQLLLGGGKPSDYGFTRDTRFCIDGVDDAVDFKNLTRGLDIMGLSEKEQLDLFRVVAAVLHLGNIEVTSDYRGDRADVKDFASIERLCHLLGIPAQDFKKSLLSPRIKAGRDWVNQAKSPAQVTASLDALAKTLYERNFGNLVDRVNKAIDSQPSTDKLGFIGVLDIAGFEIFDVNSFEQLCINYTNEKLQQFFNHNMFVLEQEEYEREKINWDYIDFGLDLQPTIDLIEKTNPIGILSCLEEECVAPRGTDTRFLQKLHKVWDTEEPERKYMATRFKDGFVVKHYAGNVEYSTSGWIDKNKDPLNEDITRLLARSTQRYIAALFEDYLGDDEDPSQPTAAHSGKAALLRLRKGTGSFRTVGQRHKQQLLSLMETLNQTHPHFVRCILPNNRKRAGEIQPKLVLDQLRCNGVLEGIRICRKGFPNRLAFADFRKRYEIVCPNELRPNCFIDGRSACQTLLDTMQLDPQKYRIGTTKVFFRATVLAELEELRDRRLAEYMTGFQAMCRKYIARRHMTRFARQTEAIKVMQRNARIYVTLREWPWWKVYAKLKPLNVAYRIETQIKERDQKIQDLTRKLEEQTQVAEQQTQRNHELASQQTEYEDLVKHQEAMVRELEEGKRVCLEKLASAEDVSQALEQENGAQASMIARLHKEIRECSDDNEKLATQVESLQQTNETLAARVEYLETNNRRLTAEVEENKASKDKLEQELATRATVMQEDVDAKDQRIKELEQALEVLKAEHDKTIHGHAAALASSEQRMQEIQQRVEASEMEKQGLVSERDGLERQVAESKETLARESEAQQALEGRYQELLQQWNELLEAEAAEAKAKAERMEKMRLKFA